MSSKHSLPKKLEDDLDNVKYYKPSAGSEKTKSVSAVLDDSVERAMYDEILGPLVNRKSSIPSTRLDNAKQLATNTSASGTDFNTSILTRLQSVEADNKALRRQLAEQVTYNEKLEKEVVDLKSLVNDPEELRDELQYFRTKTRDLQKKIKEMEGFLADYGLVWVGDEGGNGNEDTGEDPSEGVCFSDFLKHIKDLNEVVYSDPAQVITEGHNSRKARLVQASELVENIKITFYKNGLMIRRGPFREIGSETYGTFMNDILDGYFPSEFKKEFPDGVTFDVIDKHSVVYVEGQTDSDTRMSAAQLLNRLPKTIIKNGELIDIRGDIESRLGGGGAGGGAKGGVNRMVEEAKGTSSAGGGAAGGKVSSMVVLPTPAFKAHGKASNDRNGSSPLGVDVGTAVVQIQVKWTDNGVNQTLLAHMFESDTIESLRSEIVLHFGGRGSEVKSNEGSSDSLTIELRSAYPPRVLSDAMTLKDAGLLPNGTVHARKL